ncbi:hypothetical protein FRB99_008487 [Tulasnella sp. 403]|nr:hypothetical protein FRB99_008487 [Tulasnella sp. 403]
MKQRAYAVNGWKWVIEDGLPIQTWNATAFVERMVQNRFGMLVIGGASTATVNVRGRHSKTGISDSLSDQMFVALRKLLSPPKAQGVPLTVMQQHTDVWLDRGYTNRTDVLINPKHPVYQHLQQLYPNVPPERFREPIAIGVWTDILLTDTEVGLVMHEVGYDAPIKKNFRTQGNWRSILQNLTELGGWDGERPGITIINVGAHWNPGYMFPAKGTHLIAAYSKLLKIVTDEMENFLEKLPMRVFYRAVSPGHEGCEGYHTPVSATDQITRPVEVRTNSYGWHLFPRYNDLARKSFSSFYAGGLDGIAYWDIWNMSAVRPDAHVGYSVTNWDCMHVRSILQSPNGGSRPFGTQSSNNDGEPDYEFLAILFSNRIRS